MKHECTREYKRYFIAQVVPKLEAAGVQLSSRWRMAWSGILNMRGVTYKASYGAMPMQVYAHLMTNTTPATVCVHVFGNACTQAVWSMYIHADGSVVDEGFDFAYLMRGGEKSRR